jgi:hypothetical protein
MGDCVNETTEVVYSGLTKAFENRKQLEEQITNSLKTIAQPRLSGLKKLLSNIISQ